jgi:hypothetical protein
MVVALGLLLYGVSIVRLRRQDKTGRLIGVALFASGETNITKHKNIYLVGYRLGSRVASGGVAVVSGEKETTMRMRMGRQNVNGENMRQEMEGPKRRES